MSNPNCVHGIRRSDCDDCLLEADLDRAEERGREAGYREGLLAAARMASARAGVYGHSVGCGGRPSPSERLQYIHDRCSRCQFKRLASDLRKKAKGKP